MTICSLFVYFLALKGHNRREMYMLCHLTPKCRCYVTGSARALAEKPNRNDRGTDLCVTPTRVYIKRGKAIVYPSIGHLRTSTGQAPGVLGCREQGTQWPGEGSFSSMPDGGAWSVLHPAPFLLQKGFGWTRRPRPGKHVALFTKILSETRSFLTTKDAFASKNYIPYQ